MINKQLKKDARVKNLNVTKIWEEFIYKIVNNLP